MKDPEWPVQTLLPPNADRGWIGGWCIEQAAGCVRSLSFLWEKDIPCSIKKEEQLITDHSVIICSGLVFKNWTS